MRNLPLFLVALVLALGGLVACNSSSPSEPDCIRPSVSAVVIPEATQSDVDEWFASFSEGSAIGVDWREWTFPNGSPGASGAQSGFVAWLRQSDEQIERWTYVGCTDADRDCCTERSGTVRFAAN